MESNVQLLGPDGKPLPERKSRALALNGSYSGYGSTSAFDARFATDAPLRKATYVARISSSQISIEVPSETM